MRNGCILPIERLTASNALVLKWPRTARYLAGKEVAKEIYGDDNIENDIIQQAINNRKKPGPFPSEGTVLLP